MRPADHKATADSARLNAAALVTVSKREFNTPIREPWNALIHQSLQAIDRHNRLWFDSGEEWHLQQAHVLREYVAGLKTWIHREEAQWTKLK